MHGISARTTRRVVCLWALGAPAYVPEHLELPLPRDDLSLAEVQQAVERAHVHVLSDHGQIGGDGACTHK